MWVAEFSLLVGTLSVVLAVGLMRLWDRRINRLFQSRIKRKWQRKPTQFLFKNKELVDASPPARSLLNHISAPVGEWQRLLSWLELRFTGAVEALESDNRPARIELMGRLGTGAEKIRLVIDDLGRGLTRVTLSGTGGHKSKVLVDAISQQAVESELDLLRNALDHTPTLIWREDNLRRITWANTSYIENAKEHFGTSLSWPLPRLLSPPENDPESDIATTRAQLGSGDEAQWYDCHRHEIGGELLYYALPADASVRAERSLRDFVQTLTKTFTGLHIGLAIFDRKRNLQLFNPALLELTGLPPSLLAARPTLSDFLDQLRERRMLPEPKDYHTWRTQFSNPDSTDAAGNHVEEWSLPGGLTYRVTVSPHPDGGIAFLFEDFTNETLVTREARAELMLGKTVIDGLEKALVVFGPGGQALLSNRAYREFWGDETTKLSDAISVWRGRILPGEGFEALCDCLHSNDPDLRGSGSLAGVNGQSVTWTVVNIGSGQRMLSFRISDSYAKEVEVEDVRSDESLSSVAMGGN